MHTIKRRRQDAAAWRAMLARFPESGLSVSAFCRSEAISEASFYRWRSQLAATPVPVCAPSKQSNDAFVDLGPLSAADDRPVHFDLRLDLGNGVVLQLRRD